MTQIPSLSNREKLIDKFSNYIQLENQRLNWCSDRHLVRNFKLYEEQLANHEEFDTLAAIELVWVKIWLDMALGRQQQIYSWEPENRQQLALKHLGAYCDSACYWAARAIASRYQNIDWEHCLYIARTSLWETDKIIPWINAFDIERASLSTYIQGRLLWHIQDRVSVGKISAWRSLYKVSEVKLKEALANQGIQEPELSYILFARKHFKQVYLIRKINNPNREKGQKWSAPDVDDFAEAAQTYNSERIHQTAPYEVFVSSSDISGNTVETWMKTAIEALYHYSPLSDSSLSLDSLTEAIGYEVPNEDSNNNSENTFATLDSVQEEQSNLQNQINLIWEKNLETLDINHRRVALLHYGFQWKQTRIGKYINSDQSSVSRHLTRIKKSMLQSLGSIMNPEEWVENYVRRWLRFRYRTPEKSNLIHSLLSRVVRDLPPSTMQICRYYFGQGLDEQQVAESINISVYEVSERLQQIRGDLVKCLFKELEVWTEQLVKKWLPRHHQDCVTSICKELGIALEVEFEEATIQMIVDKYLNNQSQ